MNRENLSLLLSRSLDGELSGEERDLLKVALKEHPWLRLEREELLETRAQLSNYQAPENAGFSSTVMEAIREIKDQKTDFTLVYLFPRVAAACLIILFVYVINLYFTQGSIDVDNLVGLNDVTIEEAYSYLMYYEQE